VGDRIDVDHLGAIRDVARGLGVTRQRVAQIVSEDPTTPAPVTKVAAGSIALYDLREWASWAKQVGRTWNREKAAKRTRPEPGSED
jgi:hypothetical protein